MLPRAFICTLVGVNVLWAATTRGLPPSATPAKVGGKGEEAVRCVSLPCAVQGDTLNLYVARTKAKLPSTVLVLYPDQQPDLKTLLSSPAWQDFAEDHHLGLVAVMATTAPIPNAKNASPPSWQAQTNSVLQAVDHEFGASIPILLYGGPQQAAFAGSLLTANPKRVTGWCLREPAHLPDANGTTPPGIVVCYKESKSLYDALTKDFTLARRKGARLTWISLAGDKPTADALPALDSFVRNYLAATLSTKIGLDGWENIETKQAVSAMDVNTHPERSSYLPRFSLAPAWANLHVPGGPELARLAIQEREEDTFNPAQPKLHLYLRKPLSAEKTGNKIEGVLAFCTWWKEKDSLIGRLQDKDYFLVRYAEEHRLALLTWDTAEAWSKKESADQRSQQENFQDDLGFEKLANAWECGVHVLCHDAGLPENDFLLYGVSRGAQWAHRLALRKPGHFLAIHIHINSSYDWPTPAAKSILWLQTTGDREAGYEAAKRFYARCREMGYPIIFKAGENLGHSDSGQIDALGLRFFDYALGVKARRDAVAANPKTLRGKQASPSLYALSGMEGAPFYADFINQDVYGADEKDMVPVSQRVPLPTQALAQAWGGSMETSALTLVSNSKTVPTTPPTVKSTSRSVVQRQANDFGSSLLPDQMPPDAPISTTTFRNEDPSKPGDHPASAVLSPDARPTSTPPAQDVPGENRPAVPSAVTQRSGKEPTGSLPGAMVASRSRKLQALEQPVPTESPWSKQVAQIMREQSAAHPSFPQEYEHSFQRAAAAYPALAEVGSAVNNAFWAEYHRLDQTNDGTLGETTWPEQVAHTVGERMASQ